MGLFKKKRDPIAERAEALNRQIAEIEAQIQDLAALQAQTGAPTPATPATPGSRASRASRASPASPTPAEPPTPTVAAVEHPPPASGPRLRSTAKPHAPKPAAPAPAAAAPRPQEPIFEEVDHERLQARQEEATSGQFGTLGVRNQGLSAAWHRVKSHFRGPATTNPKLVNYLAAGSIQGLRPMRYEKRVARNRFIVLVVFLALAMWGLIAIFMKGSR